MRRLATVETPLFTSEADSIGRVAGMFRPRRNQALDADMQAETASEKAKANPEPWAPTLQLLSLIEDLVQLLEVARAAATGRGA